MWNFAAKRCVARKSGGLQPTRWGQRRPQYSTQYLLLLQPLPQAGHGPSPGAGFAAACYLPAQLPELSFHALTRLIIDSLSTKQERTSRQPVRAPNSPLALSYQLLYFPPTKGPNSSFYALALSFYPFQLLLALPAIPLHLLTLVPLIRYFNCYSHSGLPPGLLSPNSWLSPLSAYSRVVILSFVPFCHIPVAPLGLHMQYPTSGSFLLRASRSTVCLSADYYSLEY